MSHWLLEIITITVSPTAWDIAFYNFLFFGNAESGGKVNHSGNGNGTVSTC